MDLGNFPKEYERCCGSENLDYNVHLFAKQATWRYAEKMSFCDGLQVTPSTNTIPITGRNTSSKQVIVYKNSKITSFEPDNVVVHGKSGLVTDIGENELLKFRSFIDPRDYSEDPFPSRI